MAGQVRILAVDDNEVHGYSICRALQRRGFETTLASSGSQALQEAGTHPDVILLDLHLPDITGYEVCRRLKANQKTSDIPIVMFSAISQSGSAVMTSQQLGVSSFLFFPIEPQQLEAVILGAIARRDGDHGSAG